MWLDIDGAAVLSIEAPPPGLLFDSGLIEVECMARFGHLTFSWVETRTVSPDGRMSLEISPPPEAFLHELADEYITDLQVYVHFGRIKRSPGAAFIVWRDGVGTVHPVERMAELAPYGMVGGLREGMVASAGTRFLPPISNDQRVFTYVPSAEEAP